MICRVQHLTINSWRNTEKMITPFCPLDVEKGRSKAGKSPRIKVNGGRIRDLIQKTLIISAIWNNLPWLNQVRKIKANRQLAKPQLTSTH
jgi:hypothetical protein